MELAKNKNFVIIGVGGYIAPRHLDAIKQLGGNLLAAFDKNDSVGIMDRYFPDCRFFTDFERFESYLQGLKEQGTKLDFVSICTPNYMHYPQIQFGLRMGCDIICEKPLVLHESEIDHLLELEKKYNKKVYTVLQLRVHDSIIQLKQKIQSELKLKKHFKIQLEYMTSRGQWYHESWKGDVRKSGGLSSNIGVHFFDMLTWIFGEFVEIKMQEKTQYLEKGVLRLKNAEIDWMLTIDKNKLPEAAVQSGKTTFRSIKIDGEEFEFSEGFTELHYKVYSDILNKKGYGLEDSRTAISIVEKIRGIKI